MKKFLTSVLLLAMLISLCTVTAFADDDLDALKETWLSDDQYYYSQLSDAHKEAWEFVIANVLNYPNQTAADENDYKYQALGPMIAADNPKIFWMNEIYVTGMLHHSLTTSTLYELPTGISSEEEFRKLQETFLKAIDADVAEIQSELSETATTYETLKAIYDWLCENNTYNDDQTSSHKKENDPISFAYLAAHSAYSAIVQGDDYEPVCEGYALAFKLLCNEFGIECICVSGSTSFASAHMWNYVKMDNGYWYLVDVTNGDSGDTTNYTCFLGGSKTISRFSYTPDETLGSGITTSNGYDEDVCATFTFPKIETTEWWYVIPPEISYTNEYGGKIVTITGNVGVVNTSNLYIYYTDDSTSPTTDSAYAYAYNQGTVSKTFWITETTTVSAMTRAGGSSWTYTSYSDVVSQTVTVSQTEQPTISISGTSVTITADASSSQDVIIYYTTDGSEPSYVAGDTPTINGTLYDGTFTAEEGTTIKAIAVDKGCTASNSVTTEVQHVHRMSHHSAVEAGCETTGNIEYWYCDGCNKYYADSAGNEEISAGPLRFRRWAMTTKLS